MQLQKLWLMENCIARIEGLSALTALKELYLYSNRIERIEGLEALTGLEVLWLSDNYLTAIEGLGRLRRLRELHLARNDIEAVPEAIALNSALAALNLADNAISNFQARRRRRQRRSMGWEERGQREGRGRSCPFACTSPLTPSPPFRWWAIPLSRPPACAGAARAGAAAGAGGAMPV